MLVIANFTLPWNSLITEGQPYFAFAWVNNFPLTVTAHVIQNAHNVQTLCPANPPAPHSKEKRNLRDVPCCPLTIYKIDIFPLQSLAKVPIT